jgi:hypothetical protein
MATRDGNGPAQAGGAHTGAGPATEQAPDVPMENAAVQILFNTKIKELPASFYTSATIGDYYMYVQTFYCEPTVVYIEKKEGCGRTTVVKFKDPDPELTISELFSRAKKLIEMSINNNCSRP